MLDVHAAVGFLPGQMVNSAGDRAAKLESLNDGRWMHDAQDCMPKMEKQYSLRLPDTPSSMYDLAQFRG